jgi:hypothetical protein
MNMKNGFRLVQEMTRTLLLVSVCLPNIALGQQASKAWKHFTSDPGGYTVDYPASWNELDPAGRYLDVVNFPPSRRVKAVMLPGGGAEIIIGGPPRSVTTVDQWISHDGSINDIESRKTIVLKIARSKEPLRATEVTFQTSEGQEIVTCYFETSGRPFAANVIYWIGDHAAGKYREVLYKVIESMRLLERNTK